MEGEFIDTAPVGAMFSAAACPHPLPFTVKKPGLALESRNVSGALMPPGAVTIAVALPREMIWAVPGAITVDGTVSEEGICRLIWPGEMKESGAGTPLIVTEVPPSVKGNGALADCVVVARLLPKILTSDPGATGDAHEAEFTTPSERICGTCAKAKEDRKTRYAAALTIQVYS